MKKDDDKEKINEAETSTFPVKPITEEEDFKLEEKNYETQMLDQFNGQFVRVIKRLSYYMSQCGMPFNEACQLVRFTPEEMTEKINTYPVLRKWFEIKELEFKKDMMAQISKKARAGDDKLALWLLERKFPEEFAKVRKNAAGDEGKDFLGMAMEFVQKSNKGNSLVEERSAKVTVINGTKNHDIDATIKKVSDILA